MAIEITSRQELTAWLNDKPREWSQAIAVRAALRVVPVPCDPKNSLNTQPNSDLILSVFRAIAISSAAAEIPTDAMGYVAAAANAAYAANAANAANAAAAAAANAAAYAAAAANAAAHADADAANAAAYADVWAQVSSDCAGLDGGASANKLIATALWDDQPEWFSKSWVAAAAWLSASPDGFDIWREWYVRRIEGRKPAFKTFSEDADTIFYQWLIERNKKWWKRPPAEVNAEVQAKVNELRGSDGAQEVLFDSYEPNETVVIADPQIIQAPRIGRSDNNKLTIVRIDPDIDDPAKDRHKRAIEKITALREYMAGTNYGAEFAAICDEILKSLGATIEELNGDGIVLDTDSLRIEFDEMQNPGKSDEWEPLSGKPKRLVNAAISALNLLIGSDELLEARETIRLGPDHKRKLAPPQATVDLAEALRSDDLSEDDTDRLMRLAAENAPQEPDPSNRRTAIATELGLNVVRWTITFIVEQEKNLPNIIAGSAIVGVVVAPISTSAAGFFAWKLAKNVRHNREKWRTIAAQAGVTMQNFERLLKILDKLPFDK